MPKNSVFRSVESGFSLSVRWKRFPFLSHCLCSICHLSRHRICGICQRLFRYEMLSVRCRNWKTGEEVWKWIMSLYSRRLTTGSCMENSLSESFIIYSDSEAMTFSHKSMMSFLTCWSACVKFLALILCMIAAVSLGYWST